ncbi:hypothetical protein RF11_11772 [Thelohanellus kitauei]|uniref:Uncharacterized protein n=1 Tax=Thelohanellus kitauei TaxID=669202 RepID=A0A0C2MG70_THEKT|nr:hypothetical protein RF11_11772 [Thelohanellus kitauei]
MFGDLPQYPLNIRYTCKIPKVVKFVKDDNSKIRSKLQVTFGRIYFEPSAYAPRDKEMKCEADDNVIHGKGVSFLLSFIGSCMIVLAAYHRAKREYAKLD